MLAEIPIIIVVDETADFSEVQAACQKHGLMHVSPLPRLGMLRGLTHPAHIDELRRIPGVTSVEREREIQLPPPNSPVQ